MFDIADVQFTDDLDVALNPEEYNDQAPPLPITAGNYAFRIKSMSLRKKSKDSKELKLIDGKYPVIVIEQTEVVNEDGTTRTVPVYQDFSLKPFMRKDFATGVERPANNLADILRSHDASISFNGLEDGLRQLSGIIADNGIFHGTKNWTATDMDWAIAETNKVRQLAAQNGLSVKQADGTGQDDEKVRTAINDVWKKARRRGMKNFKNAEGQVVPFFRGPGGEDIEARVEITKFISTNQLAKVKLGAFGA